MILLLNGAFGIGKTTVARRLRSRLPGSAVFDPEWVGLALRLLSPTVEDYQDLPAWRRLTVAGVRAMRAFRRTVIVPMAFTNLAYLNEIRGGAGRADPDVRHLCLVAPLEVVEERLSLRSGGKIPAWQLRRARDCCAVHGDPAFAEQVPTDARDPDEIASEIAERLRTDRISRRSA
jgi:chloramphenicol 3-O-phosphotransferase